jgi:hypothetical protein
MRLRGRLNRLERAYPERVVSKANSLGEFADEDWLAYFEELGRMGCLAREPDFPIALASYRGAIRDGGAVVSAGDAQPVQLALRRRRQANDLADVGDYAGEHY